MGSKWTIANSDMRGLKAQGLLPQYGAASSELLTKMYTLFYHVF